MVSSSIDADRYVLDPYETLRLIETIAEGGLEVFPDEDEAFDGETETDTADETFDETAEADTADEAFDKETDEDYSVDESDLDAFLEVNLNSSVERQADVHEQNRERRKAAAKMAYYHVDDDYINEFLRFSEEKSELNDEQNDEEEEEEQPVAKDTKEAKGASTWLKVAALLIVLAGLGWIVGTAIHAMGSAKENGKNDDSKPVSVSVSDVSSSDAVSASDVGASPTFDAALLKQGVSNSLVTAVRARLTALGYLPADTQDGGYDAAMVQAVADFREANGINETGDLDAQTFVKLFDETAVSTAPTTTTTTTTTMATTTTTAVTTRTTTTTTTTTTTSTSRRSTTRRTRTTTESTSQTSTTEDEPNVTEEPTESTQAPTSASTQAPTSASTQAPTDTQSKTSKTTGENTTTTPEE